MRVIIQTGFKTKIPPRRYLLIICKLSVVNNNEINQVLRRPTQLKTFGLYACSNFSFKKGTDENTRIYKLVLNKE